MKLLGHGVLGLKQAALRQLVDANIEQCVKRVALVAPATPVKVGATPSSAVAARVFSLKPWVAPPFRLSPVGFQGHCVLGLKQAALRQLVDANIEQCVKRVALVAPATPVEVGAPLLWLPSLG